MTQRIEITKGDDERYDIVITGFAVFGGAGRLEVRAKDDAEVVKAVAHYLGLDHSTHSRHECPVCNFARDIIP